MKSLIDQVFDFIRTHNVVIEKRQPTETVINTCAYALYDNDKHKIVNIINLSDEQANDLNVGFRHDGDYHMRYVLLKISDMKGDEIQCQQDSK